MSATAAAGFTTTQRCYMFYMICIPLRLTLSALIYIFGSHWLARSAAVVAGLASYFFNSHKIRDDLPNEVWWYRPMHMLTGVIIAIWFIISSKTTVPSAILLGDTLLGLATSFYKKPFIK
jgi:hypothetical protein